MILVLLGVHPVPRLKRSCIILVENHWPRCLLCYTFISGFHPPLSLISKVLGQIIQKYYLQGDSSLQIYSKVCRVGSFSFKSCGKAVRVIVENLLVWHTRDHLQNCCLEGQEQPQHGTTSHPQISKRLAPEGGGPGETWKERWQSGQANRPGPLDTRYHSGFYS